MQAQLAFPQESGVAVPAFVHDFDDGEDDVDVEQFSLTDPTQLSAADKGVFRIPEALSILAQKGEVLRFDKSTHSFHVLDGPEFEKQFIALRITRGKKKENNPSRPFSTMARMYQIVAGERWANTGTIFKAKDQKGQQEDQRLASQSTNRTTPSVSASPDHQPQTLALSLSPNPSSVDFVHANTVLVTVQDAQGREDQCTLQTFLEITGAGDLYRRAVSGDAPSKRPRNDSDQELVQNLLCQGVPIDDLSEGCADYSRAMRVEDVGAVVGGLWNASSLGDQAYFFKRRAGLERFPNGSIVRLVGGVLEKDEGVPDSGALHLVVSDKNAKWKGEPLPTKEEEPFGHWCCFLGQVPITVQGPVNSGDHIGPTIVVLQGDGSGRGRVGRAGQDAIVGIALNDKRTPEPGVVKVLVFAGLGALTQQSAQYHELLDRVLSVTAEVDGIKSTVHDIQVSVDQVMADTTQNSSQVQQLGNRVNLMEGVMGLVAKASLAEKQPPVQMGSEVLFGSQSSSGGLLVSPDRRGGHQSKKLLIGGAICGTILLVAVVTGVLMMRGDGDEGSAISNSNNLNVEIGNEVGQLPAGEGGQTPEPAAFEVALASRLVGVTKADFERGATVFREQVASVITGRSAQDVVINRVTESGSRRRTQMQGGTRQLLAVSVDVEYSVRGFTSAQAAQDAANTVEFKTAQLEQALRDNGFSSLQGLETFLDGRAIPPTTDRPRPAADTTRAVSTRPGVSETTEAGRAAAESTPSPNVDARTSASTHTPSPNVHAQTSASTHTPSPNVHAQTSASTHTPSPNVRAGTSASALLITPAPSPQAITSRSANTTSPTIQHASSISSTRTPQNPASSPSQSMSRIASPTSSTTSIATASSVTAPSTGIGTAPPSTTTSNSTPKPIAISIPTTASQTTTTPSTAATPTNMAIPTTASPTTTATPSTTEKPTTMAIPTTASPTTTAAPAKTAAPTTIATTITTPAPTSTPPAIITAAPSDSPTTTSAIYLTTASLRLSTSQTSSDPTTDTRASTLITTTQSRTATEATMRTRNRTSTATADLSTSAPQTTEQRRAKKVLVVGVDGLRGDAVTASSMPNLWAWSQRSDSQYSLRAQAQFQAFHATGWSSLLTGVRRQWHTAVSEDFAGNTLESFPSFFSRLPSNFNSASLVRWTPINDYINIADYEAHFITDQDLANHAVSILSQGIDGNDVDVLFAQLGDAGEVGEQSGFDISADSAYMQALQQTADVQLEAILTAMTARATYHAEDWLVVVCSDHGGSGTTHTGLALSDIRTFMMFSNPNIVEPGQYLAGPTALQRELDDDIQGLGAGLCTDQHTDLMAGNDACCVAECGIGEGDCDSDSDCAGDLRCGIDNCPWGDGDDCCYFDAAPQVLKIASSSEYGLFDKTEGLKFGLSSFTVEVVFRLTTWPNGEVPIITDKLWSGDVWTRKGFDLAIRSHGGWSATIADGVNSRTLAGHPIDVGAWHHVAMVVDREAQVVEIYHDGVKLVLEYMIDGVFGDVSTDDPIALGQDSSGEYAFGHNGLEIAEARIWNHARTTEQLRAQACASTPTDAAGQLVWQMSGGVGPEVQLVGATLAKSDVDPQCNSQGPWQLHDMGVTALCHLDQLGSWWGMLPEVARGECRLQSAHSGSCVDNIRNRDEAGVDCGGACPSAC